MTSQPTGSDPRTEGREVPPGSAWHRLRVMGRPRFTKANVLAGILAVVLGFALATQVQLTTDRGLDALRQDELIRLLDQVTTRSGALDAEVRRLEAQRDRLSSGAGIQDAVAAAQRRIDQLGLLAGTVPASGPGVVVAVGDARRVVTPAAVLDSVEELRDAGAEVIDVGGVRVVASTAFTGTAGDILVDGTRIPQDFEITAIGDPGTMGTAMKIPGGALASFEQLGATASVRESLALTVTSLHVAKAPRYARTVIDPAPGATAPSTR